VSQKATLLLKSKTPNDKNQLVWKGLKGATTMKAEFGNPLTTDSYAFCVYDNSGLLTSTTIAPGGTCNFRPCWSEKLFSFNFVDKQLAQGGILSIFLKEGPDGTAKFVVKGKGANLAMPDLTSLTSPVTVQLKNSLGNCWGAVYSFPPAVKNDPENFKDKSD
jgi:hypothetical protein